MGSVKQEVCNHRVKAFLTSNLAHHVLVVHAHRHSLLDVLRAIASLKLLQIVKEVSTVEVVAFGHIELDVLSGVVKHTVADGKACAFAVALADVAKLLRSLLVAKRTNHRGHLLREVVTHLARVVRVHSVLHAQLTAHL